MSRENELQEMLDLASRDQRQPEEYTTTKKRESLLHYLPGVITELLEARELLTQVLDTNGYNLDMDTLSDLEYFLENSESKPDDI